MDIILTLAITIVVQLVGYNVTNKVMDDSIEVICDEVKRAVVAERKRKDEE